MKRRRREEKHIQREKRHIIFDFYFNRHVCTKRRNNNKNQEIVKEAKRIGKKNNVMKQIERDLIYIYFWDGKKTK